MLKDEGIHMSVKQIGLRVPRELAERYQTIPRRSRNKFGVAALKKALDERDAELSKIAAEVTAEETNTSELRAQAQLWEATDSDGLEEHAENATAG